MKSFALNYQYTLCMTAHQCYQAFIQDFLFDRDDAACYACHPSSFKEALGACPPRIILENYSCFEVDSGGYWEVYTYLTTSVLIYGLCLKLCTVC